MYNIIEGRILVNLSKNFTELKSQTVTTFELIECAEDPDSSPNPSKLVDQVLWALLLLISTVKRITLHFFDIVNTQHLTVMRNIWR